MLYFVTAIGKLDGHASNMTFWRNGNPVVFSAFSKRYP